MPVTNTLAYYEDSQITAIQSFITFARTIYLIMPKLEYPPPPTHTQGKEVLEETF
jgi:hypothetical protein